MENKFFNECKNKEREFQHKKKMDKAYYCLDIFSMILGKVPPLIFELIRLLRHKTKPEKSWQNILHLKKLF